MRNLIIAAGLTYLAGCQPMAVTTPDALDTRPVRPASGDGALYRVDDARTDIRILVYRSGPLASFGHNHVISARRVSGLVAARQPPDESSFELSLPVAELLVDDPSARTEAGEDFSSLPSADDIAGTVENMFSPGVLDFPRYPTITLAGQLVPSSASPQITFAIRVKEYVARGVVPVVLSIQDDLLTISGSFELSHEDLGLEPFSVMMGMLRVADVLELRFSITATRVLELESPTS